MDRQPHREQAVIAERVERDVRRINLNAVFGLVLVMWALGIIYQFLGLLPEVVNLVVPFVPLGLSLHSFNHVLFPGQEAPVSTPFCQWIPILSLIVFINNAITLPSRNKLHALVCVVTMILGFAQIILENIQAHLPLWFAQAMHFFIVTVHFKIWYYTFVIVRRREGR